MFIGRVPKLRDERELIREAVVIESTVVRKQFLGWARQENGPVAQPG